MFNVLNLITIYNIICLAKKLISKKQTFVQIVQGKFSITRKVNQQKFSQKVNSRELLLGLFKQRIHSEDLLGQGDKMLSLQKLKLRLNPCRMVLQLFS